MTNPTAHTDIPVLTATEQYLHTIRMRLEDAFANLKIAHEASVVCRVASKQTSTDCDEEIASVLFNIVSFRIDMQMRVISTIVEELGGRTEFTEGREQLRDLIDKVNHQGKYAADNRASDGSHEQE